MVVAQKSLINVTESAAMRASHALDKAAYYRGDSGPGVPIDCAAARRIVDEELAATGREREGVLRPELLKVKVVAFKCTGDILEVTSTARANLPYVLPGAILKQIDLNAIVGVRSKRMS